MFFVYIYILPFLTDQISPLHLQMVGSFKFHSMSLATGASAELPTPTSSENQVILKVDIVLIHNKSNGMRNKFHAVTAQSKKQ